MLNIRDIFFLFSFFFVFENERVIRAVSDTRGAGWGGVCEDRSVNGERW